MSKKGECFQLKNFGRKKLPIRINVHFERILLPEDKRKQNPS